MPLILFVRLVRVLLFTESNAERHFHRPSPLYSIGIFLMMSESIPVQNMRFHVWPYVRTVDVAEVEKQDGTGAQQETDRSRVVLSKLVGMVEIEQNRAEIETKAKVEQKMQKRSGEKLWAGGQQSEIAGPT